MAIIRFDGKSDFFQLRNNNFSLHVFAPQSRQDSKNHCCVDSSTIPTGFSKIELEAEGSKTPPVDVEVPLWFPPPSSQLEVLFQNAPPQVWR